VEIIDPPYVSRYRGRYEVNGENVKFNYTQKGWKDSAIFEGKFDSENAISGEIWEDDEPENKARVTAVRLEY